MNINRVTLAGYLTRDPQLSYTPSQTAIVQFGVAVNRKWTGQDGSQKQEVCFVDLKGFGKRAEVINKFFKKGKPIYVEGHLALDEWTKQDGTKMSKLRVIVDDFQFVGENTSERHADPEPESPPSSGPAPDEEIPF